MAKSKMVKMKERENERLLIFLYARVSTDRQAEEGHSIDVQTERMIGFINSVYGDQAFDYELFIDDGYTGSNINRPDMQRMIHRIENGEGTHVIVYKLDRLSRSQRDTLYLIEDVFLANNVAFVSVMESFNTSDPFGRAVLGILSVFAQLERENIYERTRSGMQKRVASGLWPGGGGVPYGYDYDKEQGILVPNQDAETVRAVYDLYLQGNSLQRIADMLNLKYEKLAQQILCRKTYAGYIVYNGVEYKGKHEPIIPLETYERAMRRFQENSANHSYASTDHLLTGLCVCGVCGAKMRYMKWGKQGFKLVCYSRMKSKPYLVKDPNCQNGRFSAEQVEQLVVQDLFRMTRQDYSDTEPQSISTNLLELLQSKYRTAENSLKRLYRLYASSDDHALLETIDELKAELAELDQKIKAEETCNALSDNIRQAKENLKSFADIWDYMDVTEQRAAIRSVVDAIELSPGNINIRYKF